MVMNAKNTCSFIITRGERRGQACQLKCLGQYCRVHNRIIKSRNDANIIYKNCGMCNEWTRSKYGACYCCCVTKNVRYHTLVNGMNLVKSV